MKTERRHDLETNELARHLAEYLERIKPHVTTFFAVLAIIGVVFVAGSYMRRAAAARSGEAWDAYNLAVEGRVPDLDLLKQSAEVHAGTPMAQWSDITWADGQLFAATRLYVQNRAACNERLAKAEGVYANLSQSADSSRVRDRALFGQARVHEMRGQLAKAREAYARVSGAFAELAQQRIESIDSEQTKETYDWLISAEPPRGTPPTGPGTPGQKPDFQVDSFAMPGDEGAQSESLEDILDRYERETTEQTSDRYQADEAQANAADTDAADTDTADTDTADTDTADTDTADTDTADTDTADTDTADTDTADTDTADTDTADTDAGGPEPGDAATQSAADPAPAENVDADQPTDSDVGAEAADSDPSESDPSESDPSESDSSESDPSESDQSTDDEP